MRGAGAGVVLLGVVLLGGCAKRHHSAWDGLLAGQFSAYQRTVIETVMGHWHAPPVGSDLTAAVQFHIRADGAVGGIQLLREGSGSAGFDAAALWAVQHMGPLPAPPSNLATTFERFVIEFHSHDRVPTP